MGTFAVGDIVLVPFPYADFSIFKKRPALIAGKAEFDNFILCQITSKPGSSTKAVVLNQDNFSTGSLNIKSYIRTDKLFTTEQTIIEKKLAVLDEPTLNTVRSRIRQLFSD